MDSGFNFNDFARDEALQTQISEIMDAIQEQGDPALRERFANLRRRHKIENEQDPPPNFHFNTAALTYEDVTRHCAQNNLNLRRLVFVQGDRFYVSRNYALGENQVWDEIASPSSVDIQQESAQLAFLDPKKVIVDWPLTLENLNNMIRQKPYSEAMLRNCLLRFVNHYESAQTEYLRNKTCDQIANFLLSLNTRIDRKAYHKSRLLSAVRRPEETLSAAVHKVRNIAESIYVNVPDPDAAAVQPVVPGVPQPAAAGEPAGPAQAPPAADAPVPEINPLVNRILINAIISFCRDDIAVPLNKRILQDSSLSRLKDYMYYLRIAMAAEMRQNAFPTVPLKYSRKLPQAFDGLVSLNTITIPDIHPCLHLAPRKNAGSNRVENYFPYHSPDRNDECNQYLNGGNVGIAHLGPHIPLNVNGNEDQAHDHVLQPPQNPPIIPVPIFQNAPAHQLAPANANIPVRQNVLIEDARPLIHNAPAPTFPLFNGPAYPPYHGIQEIPYNIEGPNVAQQIAPVPARAHLVPGPSRATVQLPTIKTIPWNELPSGVPVTSQIEGQYIILNGEKYWIDFNHPPPAHYIGTRSKTRSRPHSKQDRALPDPGKRDKSGDDRDPQRANIYAEVLSMMMQNLTKPSAVPSVPDRGRSRDNSRNGFRNLSGDRQGRQPRRSGSWDRPGYNPANGPANRLRTDRDRSQSRDRGNYRQTARSDQRRQPENYKQRDTYRKPNYSSTSRDRNKEDQNSRDRDGSAEAKRLAREGAQKVPYKPRTNSQGSEDSSPRKKTPDRRDISRDRSNESKRVQYREDMTTKAYPNMKKGFNCSASYNPASSKVCTKCPIISGHHEFDCKKYSRYNYNRCSLCDKYHHYPSDCDEVPKYPPKHSDVNSIYLPEKDPN
jgi:hypothetical protein